MLTGHFGIIFVHLMFENDPKMFSIQKLLFDFLKEFCSDSYETWYEYGRVYCAPSVTTFISIWSVVSWEMTPH